MSLRATLRSTVRAVRPNPAHWYGSHDPRSWLGLVSAVARNRLRPDELLAAMDLPVTMDPAIDPAAVVAATRSDKKRLGAHVPYVVVDAPGRLRWGQEIDDAAVLAAVEELR